MPTNAAFRRQLPYQNLAFLVAERKASIQQRMEPSSLHLHNKTELELLVDIGKVLEERATEIETHKDLSTRVSDMKQKVRRQKEQIESKWAALIEQEKKECEMLNSEKLNLETQMKNEQVGGSNTALHKIVAESKDKGNKPPPGRMGNYTIMAKRLQGEIKQLESNANEMKTRLQLEIEKKNAIETKVKEMRSSLTLHRRQDQFSAPTSPTQ
ncbi:Hypothetical protein NTJ_03252 [Nesidiocoris tenuis]|uniref:Uncharacterized protein n=1 Tax=Nesidiocoris tenuis TaxID=355587 RepID=A0ABN7ADV8_9HEMI|nr:Hypothetical protein NTJ_03252 [Nesidiocoris tenuis]